jgi:hypothetical protein
MRIIQGSPPNLIGNQAGEAAIAARFETLEIFGNTLWFHLFKRLISWILMMRQQILFTPFNPICQVSIIFIKISCTP